MCSSAGFCKKMAEHEYLKIVWTTTIKRKNHKKQSNINSRFKSMFNKKRIPVVLSMFLSLFLAVGLGNVTAQNSNIVEVIKNSENHTVFADLLEETGYNDVVSQAGPYTVIAPTDQAFEEMDQNLEDLRANSDSLESVVISHLFQGEISADRAESSLGIEITESGIEASNGTVHVSSEVIEN